MQGADWLLRCRKNRGRIETSQCDSLGILCPVCEETGEIYNRNRSRTMFFLLSLNMDPVIIIVKKKNNNNKQDNYNKKRVWLGENLKKKLLTCF